MGIELDWLLENLNLLFCCFPTTCCILPVLCPLLLDSLGGWESWWRVVSVSSDLLLALLDAPNPLKPPDPSLCTHDIILLGSPLSRGDSISYSMSDSVRLSMECAGGNGFRVAANTPLKGENVCVDGDCETWSSCLLWPEPVAPELERDPSVLTTTPDWLWFGLSA